MKKRKVRELKYGFQPEDTGQPPPTRPPRRFGEETIPLHRAHIDELKREERLERLERRVTDLEDAVAGYLRQVPSTPQEDAERPSGHTTLAALTERRDADCAAANLQALSLWTRPECWRIDGTAEERIRTRAIVDHLNSLVQIAINGGEVPRP